MEKKEEEKYFLLLFKKLYDRFPDGEIISSEKPDFIVKTENSTYGVELSKIYQKTKIFNLSPQASDSIGYSIVNMILNKLNNYEISFLDVLIDFTFQKPYTTKEREKISNVIVKLIIDNIPDENESLRIYNEFENEAQIPFEVSTMRILNHPFLERNSVSFPRYGFFQHNMINNIQEVLKKKDDKIKIYKPYDEQWLLIYALGGNSGGFFDPSEETINHKYHTKFDRIFLLISLDNKVYELKKI
ncbi:MAG: hypothetical protein CVV23_05290 [Ignavibacteriae bacterium HGW-Ignavibacteriae-2]|jgi:hypothetical protein|nr:MAG: hypothetical protein CVV23_05290 [Ignavibacteriae bacterium HGW-Ignavibacteriae-2]